MIARAVALSCLLAEAAAAAPPADERAMPVHAGVLPNQKQIQVRFEKGSAHLPDAETRAALAGAMRAWNALLPADLKLVDGPNNGPMPAGEVVFMVRFDGDPSHFGGSGVDEIGDVRGIIDRKKNHAIAAVFLFDKAGAFSTNGAPGTRDLELVLMHELGHALGMDHVFGATGMPPIMAPALDENAKLLAGGKTLAAVRQPNAEDKERLEIGMIKRETRELSGSYTGTFTVDKVGKGPGGIQKGHKLPVREGDFVLKLEDGKVKLDYKGSKREVPATDLLELPWTIEFPDVADGRTLRTITISRGEGLEFIEVKAVLEPLRVKYEVSGALKREGPRGNN